MDERADIPMNELTPADRTSLIDRLILIMKDRDQKLATEEEKDELLDEVVQTMRREGMEEQMEEAVKGKQRLRKFIQNTYTAVKLVCTFCHEHVEDALVKYHSDNCERRLTYRENRKNQVLQR